MSSVVIMPCSWNETLINLCLVHIHVRLQLMDGRIHLKHTHQVWVPGVRFPWVTSFLNRQLIFLKWTKPTKWNMRTANTPICPCICAVRFVSSRGVFIGPAKNETRPLKTYTWKTALVQLARHVDLPKEWWSDQCWTILYLHTANRSLHYPDQLPYSIKQLLSLFLQPRQEYFTYAYERYTVYQANGPFKIFENLLQKYILVGCPQHMLLLVTKHFIEIYVQPWYSSNQKVTCTDHKHAHQHGRDTYIFKLIFHFHDARQARTKLVANSLWVTFWSIRNDGTDIFWHLWRQSAWDGKIIDEIRRSQIFIFYMTECQK